MMVDLNKELFGAWKMTAMRFINSEGVWEDEKVIGGTSLFTQSGVVTTFTRTSDLAFGYSGTYKIDGKDLIIHTEVCSIPELEGRNLIRTVKKLTSENLTLEMEDEATGRLYEIDFKLLTSTFGH